MSFHQKLTAIVPKFSSAFSVAGSASIIWACVKNRQECMQTTYHRLMLGMSVFDLLGSSAWFLTTWPAPKGSPYVWGAVGNQQTCQAQGFFVQLSISAVVYNGFLALYYVLVVTRGWKKNAVRKAEKVFHFIAIFTGVSTAVAGIPLTLYNSAFGNCWIHSIPVGCKESWKNGGETTCVRGDNKSLYQWVFYFVPMWLVMATIAVSMGLVYRSSKQKEKMLELYVQRGGALSNKANSDEILRQCFLYIFGFYISWIPVSILTIVVATGNSPFWLIMVSLCTYPAQGAFSAVVYHHVSASHAEYLL